jgi:hypothetical protein
VKHTILTALAFCALTFTVGAQNTFQTEADGFIRNWLVLAPIPITGQSGADEIHHDFLNGEAAIKPKDGDQVKIGDTTLTWKAHQAFAYFIDFRQSFDPAGGEYTAGYAVSYVLADAPMDVTLGLGTNDQGKSWLNGKEVFTYEEARVLDQDSDRIPVSLVKGQNVLVLKVVNEINSWQSCARFLRGDAPVTNLRISLTPE